MKWNIGFIGAMVFVAIVWSLAAYGAVCLAFAQAENAVCSVEAHKCQ